MKQPRVRPPSAGVLNTASHELDREPSFGSLTTDELAPPPVDIGDAPMTPNENGTGAASLDMMSFRTPREIKYRMKVLARDARSSGPGSLHAAPWSSSSLTQSPGRTVRH